ncbi:hypothetical protein B0H14DRAFT_3152907 [Mycena olivaceomarginata]|nr:hypothetical protein B0H14DRAFT_3152907 [Mycena olivaceomarginata]
MTLLLCFFSSQSTTSPPTSGPQSTKANTSAGYVGALAARSRHRRRQSGSDRPLEPTINADITPRFFSLRTTTTTSTTQRPTTTAPTPPRSAAPPPTRLLSPPSGDLSRPDPARLCAPPASAPTSAAPLRPHQRRPARPSRRPGPPPVAPLAPVGLRHHVLTPPIDAPSYALLTPRVLTLTRLSASPSHALPSCPIPPRYAPPRAADIKTRGNAIPPARWGFQPSTPPPALPLPPLPSLRLGLTSALVVPATPTPPDLGATRRHPRQPSPRRIQGDAEKITMEMVFNGTKPGADDMEFLKNFNIVVEHGPRRVNRHVAACSSMHARRAFLGEPPIPTPPAPFPPRNAPHPQWTPSFLLPLPSCDSTGLKVQICRLWRPTPSLYSTSSGESTRTHAFHAVPSSWQRREITPNPVYHHPEPSLKHLRQRSFYRGLELRRSDAAYGLWRPTAIAAAGAAARRACISRAQGHAGVPGGWLRRRGGDC